jgi:hypothetical protein
LAIGWFSCSGAEATRVPKKGRSKEEILLVLQEVEAGETVLTVCRNYGLSQQTLHHWMEKDAGLFQAGEALAAPARTSGRALRAGEAARAGHLLSHLTGRRGHQGATLPAGRSSSAAQARGSTTLAIPRWTSALILCLAWRTGSAPSGEILAGENLAARGPGAAGGGTGALPSMVGWSASGPGRCHPATGARGSPADACPGKSRWCFPHAADDKAPRAPRGAAIPGP